MKLSLAQENIDLIVEKLEKDLQELEASNTPADDSGLNYLCGELIGFNAAKSQLEIIIAAFQKGELEL